MKIAARWGTVALLISSHVVASTAWAEPVSKEKEKKADDTASLVFSASKLPKTLEEAPAIITVYDHQYLSSFGFLTLNDLLSTTPGFDARPASWFDTPATRGLTHTALLLLDGTPLNSHLSNYFPAGLGLDLSNYQRIEVISGPGGVLWGSHSLLGVVNLISRNGADINGVHGRVEFGSFGYQRYGLKAGKRWGDLDAYLGVSFVTERGANVELSGTTARSFAHGGKYQAGTDGTTTNKSDYFFEAIGKVKYKDFTLFGRIPYSRNYFQASEEGGILAYRDNGYRQSDDWAAYLMYSSRFLNGDLGVLAKGYFYRNVLAFDNRLWSAGSPYYRGGYGTFVDGGTALKLGGLAEVNWTFSLRKIVTNTLTGGIDAFRESVSGASISLADANGYYGTLQPFITDAAAFVLSPYVSDEVRLLDRIAISGGLRYNYSDSYAPVALLSGSVVARLFGQNYAKVNVGTGLRPPTMSDRFGRQPLSAPLGQYQRPDDGAAPMRPSTSTAYQFEINSQILRDVGPFRRFFVRGDFAITSVESIFAQLPNLFDPETRYALPKIKRDILSAEARLDATFRGDHAAWVSYAYNQVRLKDVEIEGGLAQVGPQHSVSAGGMLRLWRWLRVMTRATVLNGIRRSVLALDATETARGGTLVQSDAPTVFLLSAGFTIDNLYRDLYVSFVGHNLANQKYSNYAFTNLFAGGVDDGQALNYTQPGISFVFSAGMSVW
ncbi:MAG: TonB-dependent receptor plug domain-containing protein [Deltaproteobacteria bacterium]|nr:TonB-dependent receptor plug domain-containing protein [Deltaproteobacteria bacterium]